MKTATIKYVKRGFTSSCTVSGALLHIVTFYLAFCEMRQTPNDKRCNEVLNGLNLTEYKFSCPWQYQSVFHLFEEKIWKHSTL